MGKKIMESDDGKTNKERKLNHRFELQRRPDYYLPFKLAGGKAGELAAQ